MQKNQRLYAQEVLRRLKREYPKRGPFVEWSNPLELLIGTVLSAQCTDKTVNRVIKKLFKKYRNAFDYSNADISWLEKEIYSTGFYKSKAKYLKGIGNMLVKKYNGEVPNKLEYLLDLPGVANKTAHLIMAKAFGVMTGVAVDTHVARLAPRLGLTYGKNPNKIATDLEKIFPKNQYLEINEYLIMHGRAVCVRIPKCETCVLSDICPSSPNGKKEPLKNVDFVTKFVKLQ
ncbi:endonuclease III [Candidatus Peregrinibacteria bacterium]|nr:endonuclease III [Candidatus Peregrinibacteria bacterium]